MPIQITIRYLRVTRLHEGTPCHFLDLLTCPEGIPVGFTPPLQNTAELFPATLDREISNMVKFDYKGWYVHAATCHGRYGNHTPEEDHARLWLVKDADGKFIRDEDSGAGSGDEGADADCENKSGDVDSGVKDNNTTDEKEGQEGKDDGIQQEDKAQQQEEQIEEGRLAENDKTKEVNQIQQGNRKREKKEIGEEAGEIKRAIEGEIGLLPSAASVQTEKDIEFLLEPRFRKTKT